MAHTSREDLRNLAARVQALREEKIRQDNTFEIGKLKDKTFEEVFVEENKPGGYVDWCVTHLQSPTPGQDRWLKYISDQVSQQESQSQASHQSAPSTGVATQNNSADAIGAADVLQIRVDALEGRVRQIHERLGNVECLSQQIAEQLLAGEVSHE